MPASDTWIVVLALIPLLAISVLAYLDRARRQHDRRTAPDELILEYGRFVKAVPAIIVVFWAVVFISIAVAKPPQASDALPILGVVAFITAGLVPLTIELRGVRHRVSPRGIQKVSPWSPPLTIPWKDVRSVTYDSLSNWFVVDSPRGKVRLSRLLDGLAEFHRAVEAYVPRERGETASAQAAARPGGSSSEWPPEWAHLGNRLAGGIVLLVGVVMLAATWYSARSEGRYFVKVAAVGPVAIVVGIGLLIHGDAMARTGVNHLTRIYGFVGTVAGTANLHALGQVSWTYWIIPLVWLLPSWFFGQSAPARGAVAARSTVSAPNRPTRPR